jgi:hypothetical protein
LHTPANDTGAGFALVLALGFGVPDWAVLEPEPDGRGDAKVGDEGVGEVGEDGDVGEGAGELGPAVANTKAATGGPGIVYGCEKSYT